MPPFPQCGHFLSRGEALSACGELGLGGHPSGMGGRWGRLGASALPVEMCPRSGLAWSPLFLSTKQRPRRRGREEAEGSAGAPRRGLVAALEDSWILGTGQHFTGGLCHLCHLHRRTQWSVGFGQLRRGPGARHGRAPRRRVSTCTAVGGHGGRGGDAAVVAPTCPFLSVCRGSSGQCRGDGQGARSLGLLSARLTRAHLQRNLPGLDSQPRPV